MDLNFQYSTDSCVSYPSSTKTLIWALVKSRATRSVPVKVLVGTGFETCTGFVVACEAPDPSYTVETCGAPVLGFCSADDGSAPDADITCKINICK